jgi:hypothetical protein
MYQHKLLVFPSVACAVEAYNQALGANEKDTKKLCVRNKSTQI